MIYCHGIIYWILKNLLVLALWRYAVIVSNVGATSRRYRWTSGDVRERLIGVLLIIFVTNIGLNRLNHERLILMKLLRYSVIARPTVFLSLAVGFRWSSLFLIFVVVHFDVLDELVEFITSELAIVTAEPLVVFWIVYVMFSSFIFYSGMADLFINS